MSFSEFFSRQARQPTGLFGRLVAGRLFEKGNLEMNDLVKDNLYLGDDDHILEIGSGPGAAIKRIADRMNRVTIESVDFSKPMVAVSQKKNQKHINSGRLKIHLGDFNDIPFEDNRFDLIFTVNTIYFWQDPEATVAKIRRVLKPGGRLVIGFNEKRDMEKLNLATDVFRYYSTEDVRDLLLSEGFKDAVIKSRDARKRPNYCAVATK